MLALPRWFLMLVLLPLNILASTGAELYNNNCAICHGADGHGGVGVPLALRAFLEQTPDEYLRRTIRFGRPGRIMPGFPQLSDADIDKIIVHIHGWGLDTKRPRWMDEKIKGNPEAGKLLYEQHCQSCHNEKGIGGRGTGVMFSRKKDLPIMAPAIGNVGFLVSASDGMIKNIIMQGRPSTPMKSASEFGLIESDVDNIVSYLRSLQRPLQSNKADQDESASLIYESPYSFKETIENVKRAATGMNFRLIRDQHLDHGLVAEGRESGKQLMIYFCNFKFLYDALAIDPRVGMFLPCRITVVEQDNKVLVMSINPRRLSRLFNNNALDDACDEMHKLYTSILEEATL